MKKVDYNTVGAAWTAVLIIGMVLYFLVVEPFVAIAIVGAGAVGIGAPWLITWFWNRFIADE